LTDLKRNEKKKKSINQKSKIADSKKLSFSTTPDSQYFFAKISGIGPWVDRIN
jgi:hypothetical protein